MSGHDSKACTACLAVEPFADFYDDKRLRDGKCHWCKECTLANRRRNRYASLPGSKRCTNCGIDKPLADFRKNDQHPSGRNPSCKQCADGVDEIARECTKCGTVKPLDQFVKTKNCRNGRAGTCRDCRGIYIKSYAQTETGRASCKRHLRKGQLKRKYGLTPECFDAMLLKQGGNCRICGSSKPGRGHAAFFVDHDHKTGRVRGLLCHLCNNGLGNFRDDPGHLRRAIEYLLAGGLSRDQPTQSDP